MNGFDESWCTEGDLCCVIAQLLDTVGSQTSIHCLCLILHKIHWPFFHWQIRCPLLISRAYIFAWQHNLHVNNKLPPSITAVQLSTARRWLLLLSLNLHNLCGSQEASEAGRDCIIAQVKGRWWLIHEAVCREPSLRIISCLSATAHEAKGVGQCCVSWWALTNKTFFAL